jgi:hypothetical protein
LPKQLDDLIARIAEYAKSLRARVLAVLLLVALVSSLVGVLFSGDWTGLLLNFGTEMAGAVATYALLEVFLGSRERREARKADLIAQLGSQVKDVAVAAAEELRRLGWLTDGSLRGVFLAGANLEGAILAWANLQGAILAWANLQWAALQEANLQAAILAWANLQGAILAGANLQWAALQEANLQGTTFNEKTTLPDGTEWTPDTDLTRFTDPEHPDFWSHPAWVEGR